MDGKTGDTGRPSTRLKDYRVPAAITMLVCAHFGCFCDRRGKISGRGSLAPPLKIVFENIQPEPAQSFHCERIAGPDYGTPWHFHPELELTLVLRSKGHRLIGDTIAPLVPGDLVLVGSNLPHVWHQDRAQDASPLAVDAIVIQFASDFLGAEFMRRPELRHVAGLFERAGRGLHVTGATRDAVVQRMRRLLALTGLDRLLELLHILATLAGSSELKPVASVGFRPTLDHADQQRMERVCRHIDIHLADEITRTACAAAAHLSPGAFSRFFRARTGKALPAYVNELRIGRACHLLGHTDEKITEIGAKCGFANIANFNQHFRSQHGMAPRDFRRKFRLGAAIEKTEAS